MTWSGRSVRRALVSGLSLLLTYGHPARVLAQDPGSPSGLTVEQTAVWQAEVNHARQEERSGGLLKTIGWVTFGGGVYLVAYGAGCDRCGAVPATTGFVASMVGVSLAAIGGRRAHDSKLSLAWLESHGPTPLPLPRWQGEVATQLSKRSAGRKIQLGGLAVLGAGFLMESASRGCNVRPQCGPPYPLSLAVLWSGAIVENVGANRAHEADVTLRLLQAHPPAGPLDVVSPASTPSAQGLTFQPFMVKYTVRW